MKQYKQAFTLIELLVVVLIIGILAAVALPQYRIAVAKSRIGRILPVLQTLAEAEEVYFLQNGTYTSKIEDLDVDIPADCTQIENSTNFACGKHFIVGLGQHVWTSYYDKDNTSCDLRDLQISFRLQHYSNKNEVGKRYCVIFVKHERRIATAVCPNLGLEVRKDYN